MSQDAWCSLGRLQDLRESVSADVRRAGFDFLCCALPSESQGISELGDFAIVSARMFSPSRMNWLTR